MFSIVSCVSINIFYGYFWNIASKNVDGNIEIQNSFLGFAKKFSRDGLWFFWEIVNTTKGDGNTYAK